MNLHDMQLLSHKQFYLYFTEVYLQGGQSHFQAGSHQLIVFSSIRLVQLSLLEGGFQSTP